MAEAVAAFYAVETAVEGAVVGAYAVSQPTVPLHARFRKLKLPATPNTRDWNGRIGHTLSVVAGKGYIFGGDSTSSQPDADVRVITLPTRLQDSEVDVQVIKPVVSLERPLIQYADSEQGGKPSQLASNVNDTPEARAGHSSTRIDANIYILGGRRAVNSTNNPHQPSQSDLFDLSIVHCFSTKTNEWTTLRTDAASCADGIPAARTSASCVSMSSPVAGTALEASTGLYGTLILHGGYDSSGQMLRDTWAFDIRSRTWKQWPVIPDPGPEEVAGEGKIICRGATLCRIGDGFGKISFLDFDVVTGEFTTPTSGPHHGEVRVQPRTGQWQDRVFGGVPGEKPAGQTEKAPIPRKGAGFLPITTGGGRFYNLYFMGQDSPNSVLGDLWTFQVRAETQSLAAVKDNLRGMVGKATGEDEWASCNVIESTKADGPLELPKGLSNFAADVWSDLGGGNVVLWGGIGPDGGTKAEGWLLSLE